jgi:hypothetical protein
MLFLFGGLTFILIGNCYSPLATPPLEFAVEKMDTSWLLPEALFVSS